MGAVSVPLVPWAVAAAGVLQPGGGGSDGNDRSSASGWMESQSAFECSAEHLRACRRGNRGAATSHRDVVAGEHAQLDASGAETISDDPTILVDPSCAATLVRRFGRNSALADDLRGGSSRRPTNTGWRRWSASVHSAKLTWATSSGRTHARLPATSLGTGSNGQVRRDELGERGAAWPQGDVVEARCRRRRRSAEGSLVDADEDRAERGGAVAVAGRVAADHELLLEAVLDLDPRRGPPSGEVGGAGALGDHALEPVPLRGGHHRVGVVGDGCDRQLRHRPDMGLQQLAPRCIHGVFCRSAPSSDNRSNTTNEWARSGRPTRPNEWRPSSSAAITSPSRIASRSHAARATSASHGQRAMRSWPLELTASTVSPRRRTMTRCPSHFGS